MKKISKIDLTSYNQVLIDTSIVAAYFFDEPGSVDLEEHKDKILLPFMALAEFHYVVGKKQGLEVADKCFGLIKSWNIPILHSSEEITLAASRIKLRYGLGIADALIAATSLCHDAPLLTFDSDFLSLSKEIYVIGPTRKHEYF